VSTPAESTLQPAESTHEPGESVRVPAQTAVQPDVQDRPVDELSEAGLLVEDVSIDGMCGVY
jgi:mycofactocin precursor